MSDTVIQAMRGMLNGREAFRVAYSINPATGVESMSRMWWCKYDQYQEAAKHLDLYTDAGNEAETEYVTAPFAGRADSFPGKWVHSGCSQNLEADKLIQSLTRVYDITTNAELFARPAIPTFDNNIMNLFGFKESEGDAVALVIYALTKESRAFCMAIADADLVAGLAGAGFSYSARRFDVDPETNSARLTVALRKVAHAAWDSNTTASNITYNGLGSYSDSITRIWVGIRIGDKDAAVEACKNGTGTAVAVVSGYVIETASASDNGDGSITVQQMQRRIPEITITDYDKDYFSNKVAVKTDNVAKKTDALAREAGTVTSRSQSPSSFKNLYNSIETTDTSEPWDTGWVTYADSNGSLSTRRWGNQTEAFGLAIAAALTNATNNSWAHHPNRYERWDGAASTRIPDNTGGGTFWRSTVDVTFDEMVEEQYVKRRDPPNYVERNVRQTRTVSTVYRSVITQTFAVADQTKRQYMAAGGPTKRLLKIPTIQGVSDQGRHGFLVEAYYKLYGEASWVDV